MIVHIALFKWKKDVEKNEVDKFLKDVGELKNVCPGLIDIMCGENFSKYSEGFTHAVVVFAKDRSSLQTYREHPKHRIVADKVNKMEEHGIGVDFEA